MSEDVGPSSEQEQLRAAQETSARMKSAVEAADLEGFLATLAPGVVLRSPISMRAEFRGHEEMAQLMRGVFASIADIRYWEDLGDARSRALFYRARVGSQEIEESCLIRLDEEALITELTLWIRPLGGLAALAASLGPFLARQNSRPKGALVKVATKPLAVMTAKADRPLVGLVQPGNRQASRPG